MVDETATSAASPLPSVIYDFGSNNGDNLPYYLEKAKIVVAVEANPALARQIAQRFSKEISQGRLFVENCVLASAGDSSIATFYIHKFDPVLSQFPKPEGPHALDFTEIILPAKSATELIDTYGSPFYIKIDIEHYDAVILNELFERNIRPPFISAESHSIEIFSLLVTSGKYKSFNLVDGSNVATKYKEHIIRSGSGNQRYSFPHHSAGPFGEDIPGPWMTPNNFFGVLAFEQLGWKDIHATTLIEPDPAYTLGFKVYARKALERRVLSALRRITPGPFRHLVKESKRFF